MPPASVKVSMPIDVIEHLGGSSFAYSRSEMELPLTIEIRENRNVREGEVFQTGFNPQRAFLFDAGTGARLR
jgi:lactose/L-arabinose transport system ATP-binding protein